MNSIQKHYDISSLVVILFAGCLLLPKFPIGKMGFRFSDLLFLSIVPLILLFKPTIPKGGVFSYFSFFVFSMIISTFYGYAFLNVPVSLRDVNEIIKIMFPLLAIAVVYKTDKEIVLNRLILIMEVGSVIVIIFALAQFFYPASFGSYISRLYVGETHIERFLNTGGSRILLTGNNSNTGSAIAGIFFFYNMAKFSYSKSTKNLILAFLLLVSLFLTVSRAGILGLVFSLFMGVLVSKRIRFYNKLALIGFILGLIIYFIPKLDFIFIRFYGIFEGTNKSYLTRIEKFTEAYNLFMASPVFGWGPAKAIHETVVDGEYLLLLRRYGIFGYLAVIPMFGYLLKHSSFYLRSKKNLFNIDMKVLIFSKMLFYYSCMILVVMLANNFISGYQLAVPYFIIFAAVESYNRKVIPEYEP